MINPAGKLSFTLTFVRSVAGLGFVIVKVRVALAFNGIDAAEKALVIVGGDCACAIPAQNSAVRQSRKAHCFLPRMPAWPKEIMRKTGMDNGDDQTAIIFSPEGCRHCTCIPACGKKEKSNVVVT
jgi:hypothetical protein